MFGLMNIIIIMKSSDDIRRLVYFITERSAGAKLKTWNITVHLA